MALAAHPGLAAFIVALSPGGHARRRRELAATGGAFARIVSLDDLVRWVEDLALAPPIAQVEAGERLSILLDHARRQPQLAQSLAADPHGVAATLLHVLDDLAYHGLHRHDCPSAPPGPGSATVQAHLDLLHALLVAQRAEIGKRGTDSIGRLETAAAIAATLGPISQRITVEPSAPLRPLEREFLAALQAAGASVEIAVTTSPTHAAAGTLLHDLQTAPPCSVETPPDGSFVRLACRDTFEEAQAAATLVLQHLARGGSPREIALQIPQGAGYGDLVAREFHAHGLHLKIADRLPASQAPLFQTFRAFVRLWWNGPDAFDLCTLFGAAGTGILGSRRERLCTAFLSNLPTTWGDVRTLILAKTPAADNSDADRSPRSGKSDVPNDATAESPVGQVRRSSADHGAELDPVADQSAGPDPAELDCQAREAALALVTILETGPAAEGPLGPHGALRLKEAARFFTGHLANLHLFTKADLPERDHLAYQSVAAALHAAVSQIVGRAETQGLPASARIENAGAFLHSLERMVQDAVDTLSDGAIEVRVGNEALGPIDHLVILGYSRGRWPAQVGYPPLLGELERQAIRSTGGNGACDPAGGTTMSSPQIAGDSGPAHFPLAADLVAREALETRAVLGQARKRLVVLTPSRDCAGNPATASLSLVDLLERLSKANRARWQGTWDLVYGAAAADALAPGLGQAMSPCPTARQALIAVTRTIGENHPLPPVQQQAVNRLVSQNAAFPLRSGWLPDRLFAVPIALDAATTEFSASSLESLQTCRYKYYLEYVIGLRRIDLGRAPALDKRLLGTIAHQVLDRLETRIRQATEADLDAALAAELAKDYKWALAPHYRMQVAAVRQALREFLPVYAKLAEQLSFGDGHSEVQFGSKAEPPNLVRVPLPAANGVHEILGCTELLLRGAVDRIEQVTVRSKDKTLDYALGVDFKLGSTRKYQNLHALGLGIQAAVYPWAIAAIGPLPVLGFAYLSINKRQGVFMPMREAPLPSNLRPLWLEPDDVKAFRDRAFDRLALQLGLLVGQSRNGGSGDVSPHEPEFRKEVLKAGGSTCEYCKGAMLCRFATASSQEA